MHVKLYKEEMNEIEDVSSDLWHTRLGYLNEKRLNILAKKIFLHERYSSKNMHSLFFLVSNIEFALIVIVLIGGQIFFDLVHTDVCIMDDKYLGDESYFINFY